MWTIKGCFPIDCHHLYSFGIAIAPEKILELFTYTQYMSA